MFTLTFLATRSLWHGLLRLNNPSKLCKKEQILLQSQFGSDRVCTLTFAGRSYGRDSFTNGRRIGFCSCLSRPTKSTKGYCFISFQRHVCVLRFMLRGKRFSFTWLNHRREMILHTRQRGAQVAKLPCLRTISQPCPLLTSCHIRSHACSTLFGDCNTQPSWLWLVVVRTNGGHGRVSQPNPQATAKWPRWQSCVCNEGVYLIEWLAYHRAVGFDRFGRRCRTLMPSL